MKLGSELKAKNRSKTLLSEENINTKIERIFKRSYEEKLLPDLNQVNSFSTQVQKQFHKQNRDYRIHSLSLTRPFQFTKEDFMDPQQRFQQVLGDFISGKKPVDYFQNDIVDAYRFEPKIIFEDIQEKQKLSPFKDLIITNKRQVVFNSKLDESFIGHKIQEIEIPIRGGNKKLQQLDQEQKITNLNSGRGDDYYDDKNFTLTQHKQSWVKLFPLIEQNQQINPNLDETTTQHRQFYIKKQIDFDKGNKCNKQRTRTEQNDSEITKQNYFDPYQPEKEIGLNVQSQNHCNNLSSSGIQNFSNKFQCEESSNKNIKLRTSFENKGVDVDAKDLNKKNQPFGSQLDTLSNQSLKDSFQNLYQSKNQKITINKAINNSSQIKHKIVDIADTQLRQFQKQRQFRLPQEISNHDSSFKFMRKDSKYLIENFISVHDADSVRENPLSKYLSKQNENNKKKTNLNEQY